MGELLEEGPGLAALACCPARTERDHVGVEDPRGAQEGFDGHAAGAVQRQQQSLRIVDGEGQDGGHPSCR